MDWMLYPHFVPVGERGILPNITLPRDFRDRVPLFYSQGRKERVERYVEQLEAYKHQLRLEGQEKPRLIWHDTNGLANIRTGMLGELNFVEDVSGPRFQEHNLGTCSGIWAGMIAMYYVSELLKC